MKHPIAIATALLCVALPPSQADDHASPAPGHEDFIEGLRQAEATDLVEGVEVKNASEPRCLNPVVSRFKGWFIDVTGKAEESKLDGVDVASGISLASKPADSSWWQFVETDKGWLVVATGGRYRGWVVARDDAAKTRPEGPNLTVTPALRLSRSVTDNSYWDLTLTAKGLILKANTGKYADWYWDFGGGDPSHAEGEREVAINVLLAEKVVAGSYFAVGEKE